MMKWSMSAVLLSAFVSLTPAALTGQTNPFPQIEPYVVGAAAPPVDEGADILRMTLQDAIDRALEANLGLQSSRLNPIVQAWSLRAAQAAFRPTMGATFGFNDDTRQATSQLDGAQQITTQRATLNTNIAQALPWYGGSVTMNFNNNRVETNNGFQTFNPSYSTNLNISFDQPLLAGFSADNQRASVEAQQIQGQIAELELDADGLNLVNQVQTGYWDLRGALELIEIQRRNLIQAEQLLQENQARLRLGQTTRNEVIQNEAQVASAEQALLNARINWLNQELVFKQLLLGGANDPLLRQTIDPVDQPQLATLEGDVDLDGAIERALAERNDLRVSREQQRISEVNLRVTSSNALPELNLSASYALSGVGGDLFQRDQLGGAPILIAEGGFSDGFGQITSRDNPTWNLSLNASYPLGINPNRANLERAELELRQQGLQIQQQELNIVTQVTAAGLAVENTLLQYRAAERSREAQEENVSAELERFRLGVSTNFQLLQAQNQLTSARVSELQALIGHINAIAEFERVQTVGN